MWIDQPAHGTAAGLAAETSGVGAASIAMRLSTDVLAVRRALGATRQTLLAAGMQDDALDSVELALAEAMNNVVEHAYPQPSKGTIALRVSLRDGWVKCEITDGGKAMPDGALPVGRAPETGDDNGASFSGEDVPEGGFGWKQRTPVFPDALRAIPVDIDKGIVLA